MNETGKQYDTDAIVKRHDSKILMAFFADVLKLGNDQHGSFALADSKTSILAMGVESHLNNIRKVLNHDLIQQIYKLNNWDYNPLTSCRFEFGDIEKQDLDILGKFVQRVFSVGALRPTEKIEEYLRETGFNLRSFDDDKDNEIETKMDTRAGESQGSSGTGNSQSGGMSSSTNSNNSE